MKKGETVFKHSTSNTHKNMMLSSQDSLTFKTLHISIPHVGTSPDPPSPVPLRNVRSSLITPTKISPINKSQVVFNLGSPFLEKANPINKSKITRTIKDNINLDDFFSTISARNYITQIESFIKSSFNAKLVIYWEETSSIQQLISDEMQISISHAESLVGYAFLQRAIVTIPNAQQNRAYDMNIDGKIIDPNSSIIFFPLFDYKNHTIALIEIVKKTDLRITEVEENFISTFQTKFRSFSQLLLESRNIDGLSFNFIKYNDTTQFLLHFKDKMEELFDAKCSEIWIISKSEERSNSFQLYRNENIINVPAESCGTVSDILKKNQIFNCLNSRLLSSYIENIDGPECPILGIPISTPLSIVIIILRGRKNNTVFSSTNELLLSRIAPFISIGFINTFEKVESTKLSQILADSLPPMNIIDQSSEILPNFMSKVILLTDAVRASYYIIDKERIVSAFNCGMNQSIPLSIGKEYAGVCAQKKVVINVADAQNDSQFSDSFDEISGFKTTSILTVPIFSNNGSIVSIVQVLNKKNGFPFSDADVKVCQIFGTFCRLLLDNSCLCNKLNEISKNIDVLEQSLMMVNNQPSENLIEKMQENIKKFLNAESCEVFMYHELDETFVGLNSNLKCKRGSVFYCYNKKSSFFVNDLSNDSRTRDEINEFFNICVVPLISRPEGKVIGVFRVTNKAQPFDENDLKIMKMFSSIVSLLVCESKLTKYLDMNTTQIAIDNIINPTENGLFSTPAKFKLKENEEIEKIVDINFSICTFNNPIRIIFYVFESLNLMEKFQITNDTLLCFILSVQKHYYSNKSFHNFMHACDMCQFFLYLIEKGHLNNVIRKEEQLIFLVACVGAYVETDETDNNFHKRTNTPISMIYEDKPIERNKCAKMMAILNKDSSNLFANIKNNKKKDAWSLLFRLLLSTDAETIKPTVDNLAFLISESAVDLKNISHRHIILTTFYIICQYAFVARNFAICKEWFSRQKEELFILGDLEDKNDLSYSSEYHSRENAKNFNFEISTLSLICVPVVKVIVSLIQELNFTLIAVNDNLKAFNDASRRL